MRALLDVSVLLALLDVDHADHVRVRPWLEREIERGWASCAITQNGFVRVIGQERYPSRVSPAAAIARLAEASASPHHQFWACDRSLLDATVVDRSRIHSSGQLTDVYLLALAVARGGRLVTLGQRIPISAVVGASPSHLVVI